MHSGFEIPGIQNHHQQHQQENLLSTNPTHILDQIHTHQLLLNQHPFVPQSRLSHHFAAAPPPYFPVNFKLGLNSRNDCINGGEDAALLHGSEQYETRQSSLGILHCWHNQEDSPNKQTPFWEPLPAEVSNEHSEIVDNQKETLTPCLDTKARLHFGELEAIYKRPVPVPDGHGHGSETSIGEASTKKRKKKKKKKKENCNEIINPMADFFGNLVEQVMAHQENLQKKFMDVIERLEEERRAREEAWRKQELAHLEREAAVRAQEKAQAKSREAMIVSYLEKITGERINFPTVGTMENDEVD